jgi:hypothetical protein
MKITFVIVLLLISSVTFAGFSVADNKIRDLSMQQEFSPIIYKGDDVADCSEQSALTFAKQFYREQYYFYADPKPQNIAQLYTTKFGEVITNHAECVGDNGLCNLDFDPWLGAQDGYVDGEIDYSVKDISRKAVSVELHYKFRIHSTLSASPRVVSLLLIKAGAPLCWRVDDMILPDQTSLKRIMLDDYEYFYYYKKTKLNWSLLSSDFESSKIEIYRDQQPIAEYDLNCDVSESLVQNDDELPGELNTVGLVVTPSNPQGVVITSCRFGAHSKQIAIYDLKSKRQDPVWEKVGSYFAEWSINENYELVLSYDKPCNLKNCEVPFVRVDVVWKDNLIN